MLTIFSHSETDGLEQVRDTTKLRSLIAEKNQITWIDFEKPTPSETELLDTAFNFHPLTIDDCLSTRHEPKLDNYGEYLFLIVHEIMPNNSKKDFRTVELDIYLGKNYLITYHRPRMRSIETVKDRILKNPKPLFRSADFLLATVLDEVVDLYAPALDQFDNLVGGLEDQILSSVDESNILNDIFGLKRNLSRLKSVSSRQIELLTHMIKDGYDEVLPVSVPYLSNVRDHLIRASDLSDSHRDSVASLVDAYLLSSSNKTNEAMKVLTVFASIMLPLTVITGVYGMNFRMMPELDWVLGYPFVLGLMVVVAGGLFYYFRKKKWV
ncbi:MAG: magnesium/cobalt transporter CorA [Deltaproteobacteria bacterium]|nr:magnesium/cobalt transporter CorA [Deltaproteobacteria bacterium]